MGRPTPRARQCLLIEDNPDHAQLVLEAAQQITKPAVQVTWTESMRDAVDRLRAQTFHLVIAAHEIGHRPVDEALGEVIAIADPSPVLVLSTMVDPRMTAQLVRSGATEVLHKDRKTLQALPQLITRLLQLHTVTRGKRPRRSSLPPLQALAHQITTQLRQVPRRLPKTAQSLHGTLRTLIQQCELLYHRLGTPLPVQPATRRPKSTAARAKP